MKKLFQDEIFLKCTDDELILIAEYLNAAFDDSVTDEQYDELFAKMKKMVKQYSETE